MDRRSLLGGSPGTFRAVTTSLWCCVAMSAALFGCSGSSEDEPKGVFSRIVQSVRAWAHTGRDPSPNRSLPEGAFKVTVEKLQQGRRTFFLLIENTRPDYIFDLHLLPELTVVDDIGNRYPVGLRDMRCVGLSQTVPPNARVRLPFMVERPIATEAQEVSFVFSGLLYQPKGYADWVFHPAIAWKTRPEDKRRENGTEPPDFLPGCEPPDPEMTNLLNEVKKNTKHNLRDFLERRHRERKLKISPIQLKHVLVPRFEGLYLGSRSFTLVLTNKALDRSFEVSPRDLLLTDDAGTVYTPDGFASIGNPLSIRIPAKAQVKIPYLLNSPIGPNVKQLTLSFDVIRADLDNTDTWTLIPRVSWETRIANRQALMGVEDEGGPQQSARNHSGWQRPHGGDDIE